MSKTIYVLSIREGLDYGYEKDAHATFRPIGAFSSWNKMEEGFDRYCKIRGIKRKYKDDESNHFVDEFELNLTDQVLKVKRNK